MNPIIPPVWLYAIHVTDTVYDISLFALIISLCALLMFFLNYAIDGPRRYKEGKETDSQGNEGLLGNYRREHDCDNLSSRQEDHVCNDCSIGNNPRQYLGY